MTTLDLEGHTISPLPEGRILYGTINSSRPITEEQYLRIAAAGLGGWDVWFCPVCDDMGVHAPGNPSLSDHASLRDDDEHLALSVMET